MAVNGQGIVRNNIIWDNTGNGGNSDDVVIVFTANPVSDFRNNNYPTIDNPHGVAIGPDNITSDPELLPQGSVPLSSPCFEAGINARTALDINNVPRLSMQTPTIGAFIAV